MTSTDGIESLEHLFGQAVEAYTRGKEEEALKLFKQVLSLEPRIPEPRLEVAMILFRRGELEEAEAQAREALAYLEKGWRAVESLTDDQLMAHGCNLVAEILKARTAREDVMHKDPHALRAMWEEAGRLVERAARLDPDNPDVMHNYYGFKRTSPPGTSR